MCTEWREKGRAVIRVLGLAVLAFGLMASQVQMTAGGSAAASFISPMAGADATRGVDPSCVTIAVAVALGPTTCQEQMTAYGTAYGYGAPSVGSVIVTAPKTSGANNREFFWSSTSPTESDASACATFDSGNGQPGLALRISQASNPNRTTGVTVSDNFVYHVYNVFNFDVWDSSRTLAFSPFGQTKIGALPVHPTLPLHMCARILGRTVQFVVWESGMTPPPWGNPTWGGQADLPPGAPMRGQTGFYEGHIEPGTSVTLSRLTVDGTVDNPVP